MDPEEYEAIMKEIEETAARVKKLLEDADKQIEEIRAILRQSQLKQIEKVQDVRYGLQ